MGSTLNNLRDLMEIRFAGEDIFPETIRAKELADILANIEESLTNIILKENPNITIDDIIIGLVNIDKSSAKLRFKSSLQAIALSAFTLMSTSISNNDFSKLPVASIKSIRSISEFVQKRKCVAEFRVHADSAIPSATITPETQIKIPESYYLEGETVLYGRVIRVGGVTPKAVLRITEKVTIHCDVTEQLAKDLGHRLYSWVGLKGKAIWNTENYLIESFKGEGVTGYQETPLSKGIAELSSLAGKYLKDKTDVVKTIAELRG